MGEYGTQIRNMDAYSRFLVTAVFVFRCIQRTDAPVKNKRLEKHIFYALFWNIATITFMVMSFLSNLKQRKKARTTTPQSVESCNNAPRLAKRFDV